MRPQMGRQPIEGVRPGFTFFADLKPLLFPEAVHEGRTEGVVIENPVQIGAENPAVGGDSAVDDLDVYPGSSGDPGKRVSGPAKNRLSHVDLVPGQLLAAARHGVECLGEERRLHLVSLLVRHEHRDGIQQFQPLRFLE